ncbi:uncharacterized protein K452DRAFT_299171 [Aplosporella prunicola CBS 121167]|uniref:Fucose-specific lectin n=1 Tax=Aplosporella prunicola CBS 121167 TaxID=1176127 RepID=A0A6A6BA58_9PEZI|nr:uncharacterized protein K452DRAFT_299171 [Aplosporella prunicola CBS 121167]KAF2141132.1 hypothetical protein K452DRAFT_299171 [Aplosporella prunicola CBS 121167]
MTGPQEPPYSTLEVDRAQMGDLPEALPRSDPPEVIDKTIGKEVVGNGGPLPPRQTICGLRKRFFWILVVAAILVIIGVAVGAGVGATRGKSSASSSNNGNSTSNGGNGTAPYRRGFVSTSYLGAANYTDSAGIEHSQLYYQDNSLQIWYSDWNSSTDKWSFYEVVPETGEDMSPKNGTPIAASNYWRSDNDSDFRCIFVDTDNFIRFLYLPRRRITDDWSVVEFMDRSMSVSDNSSIVEYVPQCNATTGCNSADFTAYWSQADSLMVNYPFGNGESGANTGKLQVANISPDTGSAMAVTTIQRTPKSSVKYPRVAIYFSSFGYLTEIYGGYNISWTSSDLRDQRIPVDDGAQLAAISQYAEDHTNLHVLMTKTDGGVRMAYYDGQSWKQEDNVAGMEDVLPLAPIAGNQLGRIYAIEKGPQIVEWRRTDATTPKFERVGEIDTTGGGK